MQKYEISSIIYLVGPCFLFGNFQGRWLVYHHGGEHGSKLTSMVFEKEPRALHPDPHSGSRQSERRTAVGFRKFKIPSPPAAHLLWQDYTYQRRPHLLFPPYSPSTGNQALKCLNPSQPNTLSLWSWQLSQGSFFLVNFICTSQDSHNTVMKFFKHISFSSPYVLKADSKLTESLLLLQMEC